MIRRLHVPVIEPRDIVPHLAKQEGHWRAGYSAQELAVAWVNAGKEFPERVRRVLDTAPEYQGAELIDGFFEREVELGTPGRNSQTDLMVVTGLQNELGIVAVEGKVEESFAEVVSEWNTTPGKQARLEALCRTLEMNVTIAGELRYQLLHRTASAIYEARRYRCRHSMMLVHSFSPSHRWFDDFARFAAAMEMPVLNPDTCSPARLLDGVSIRLAWVSDRFEASVLAPIARPLQLPTKSASASFYKGALGELGYPGFAYLKSQTMINPAELLLRALDEDELDARVVEALPWVPSHFPDMNWDWLVTNAKLKDRQNRLAFVTVLALQLAREQGETSVERTLALEVERLERSRLSSEDTLCKASLTETERAWLRSHRSDAATHWNLLTDLRLDGLAHYA